MKERTILIVDDEIDIARFVAKSLKNANPDFAILNASNGEIGVQVAIEFMPDVIIMDWDMPILNGLEATKKLSSLPQTNEIPVILSSGKMTSSANLSEALDAGAIDYIRKPIDPLELIARTNTALRIKQQTETIKTLLEEENNLKSRKLSTTSLLLTERGNLLEEVHRELETMKNTASKEIIKQVTGIQKRLDSHLDIEKVWNTFKLHFEEVHPSFISQLLVLDATLPPKDLRLCAYLKMGMDTKDIARLMNVSSASIHTGMYRLKKRLKLAESQGLREYIVNLE